MKSSPFVLAVVLKVGCVLVNESEEEGSKNTYKWSRGRNESKRKGRE